MAATTTGPVFPPLARVVVPGRGLLRDVLLALAFSALTALAAQVAIPLPFTPVPITGQTFAVLLAGAALGPRVGALSMVLYLAEGGAGLPVFAGGTGGLAVFGQASAGYLLAFPFAAGLTGWLATRGWDRRPLLTFAAMAIGSAIIYAFGLLWLAGWLALASGQTVTLWGVLTMGMFPFLPGDLLKAVLAMGLLPGVWRLLAPR